MVYHPELVGMIKLTRSMLLPSAPTVGVLDRRVLNQRVKMYCVSLSRMVMQRDTRFILVQAIGALHPVWESDLVFLAPRCS